MTGDIYVDWAIRMGAIGLGLVVLAVGIGCMAVAIGFTLNRFG